MTTLQRACLLALLWACIPALAQSGQTRLHVSTWPSGAEFSLATGPDPANLDPLITPTVLPISADSPLVRIFLFKPGFGDTIVNVKLRSTPDNHVFIHLKAELDSAALEGQQEFLHQRTKHLWGGRVLWGSLVPAVLATVFLSQSVYHYQNASDVRDRMEKSVLTNTPTYGKLGDSFSAEVRNGDQDRTRALAVLGVFSVSLAIGGVLYF